MIKIGTLIFTCEHKYQGVQYLGRLNKDRTVASTILKLCRQNSNCTAYEVHEDINFQLEQLRQSKKYPHVEELQNVDIKTVKQHMSNVVRRSEANGSQYIPHGIKRATHSEYYFVER